VVSSGRYEAGAGGGHERRRFQFSLGEPLVDVKDVSRRE
jgi:hypothetical protein